MEKSAGFVALAGRPNAGKSTFLNLVLGEKVSIVSNKPQTTRNRILGVFHGSDYQIGFLDLPGIHKPKFKMNQIMMRQVQQGLDEADVILHFIDASVTTGPGDKYVNQFLSQRKVPRILVLNKVDLVNKSRLITLLEGFQETFQPTDLVPISSTSGENIDRLLNLVRGFLPTGGDLFGEDDLTDQPLRFMAAEFIREQILFQTEEEIPHAVAVTIERFEMEEDTCHIAALIWVDKPNHRRIVLGHGGIKIATIRRHARRSLKSLIGKPVTLELFVKVHEDWRDRQNLLSDLNLQA